MVNGSKWKIKPKSLNSGDKNRKGSGKTEGVEREKRGKREEDIIKRLGEKRRP